MRIPRAAENRSGVTGGSVVACPIAVASNKLLRAAVKITLITLTLFGGAAHGQTADKQRPYSVGPPPDWVAEIRNDAPDLPPGKEVNFGEYFTLIDEQVNVARGESFNHVAKTILNETGVQNGAQIKIGFDPAYQMLTLHTIQLVRGTNLLDRLDPLKTKVIQQENDLERHIYNGSLAVLVMLEDVRVGDRIEYSYTVSGENPIFGGRYIGAVTAQWQVPVLKQGFRILWPPRRKVSFGLHGPLPQPVVRDFRALKEYTWTFNRLPAVDADDRLPIWFNPFPWIQFTEYESWEDVARWAAELYRVPDTLPAELAERVRQWKAETAPEARVLAALQFVQDEVRYLGMEFGPFTHQPTDPAVVFSRRFGDCKDKALLLCTILKALGIEASPALVNTYSRHTITDRLPSPYVFNHVVVCARLGETDRWIDPTQSYQRGPLAARFFPDYGFCLLARPDTRVLTKIPFLRTGWPKTTATEVFSFEDYDKPVSLRVTTVAEGGDAERLRSWFAALSRDALDKQYLNYYAAIYPRIESDQAVRIQDDPEKNLIQIVESYRIKDLWSLTEDKRRWQGLFYPQTIRDLLKKPATTVRKMPLGVTYPLHQILQTELRLPESWGVTNETRVIEDNYSRLRYQVRSTGKIISLTYDYETLADAIPAAEMPERIKTLDRMHDLLGYQVYRPNGPVVAAAFQPNWTMLAAVAAYSVLLAAVCVMLYRHRPSPSPSPPFLRDPALTGLGGWLVLVGIGLCLSPLLLLSTLIKGAPSYSLATWQVLTNPGSAAYHPWWAPTLIFELFGNLTRLALYLLLIVFFFQRRAIFPRLYVILMVSTVLYLVADEVFAQMIPAVANKTSRLANTQLPRAFFSAMIWSLYMLKSRRVKLTFVRKIKHGHRSEPPELRSPPGT